MWGCNFSDVVLVQDGGGCTYNKLLEHDLDMSVVVGRSLTAGGPTLSYKLGCC